jgi:hypothetical protein
MTLHKRIKEKSQPITRAEAIDKCIQTYILNNPDEFAKLKRLIAQRRASMMNSKLGIVRDDKQADKNSSMRLAFCIPDKLYGAITTILGHGNEPFLETHEERVWFAKNYPNFLTPEKY